MEGGEKGGRKRKKLKVEHSWLVKNIAKEKVWEI